MARAQDAIVKRALLNKLSECVKDIQYTSALEGEGGARGADEASGALCDALETMLLHGLRDSLLRRARALARAARRPAPDFWPLVLVVSHRQSVEHVTALPRVTTPAGHCRAWLRAALNDSLLSSYLATLARHVGAVAPFYSRSALVCDAERLELAQRLLEGLESCVRFDLPLNSSLLNDWPESVLEQAGLRRPTARPAPVCAALDVAGTLRDAAPPAPGPLLAAGGSAVLALDEDEALKFILSDQSDSQQHRRSPTPPRSLPSPLHNSAADETSGFHHLLTRPMLRDDEVRVDLDAPTAVHSQRHTHSPADNSLRSPTGVDDSPDLHDLMQHIHAEFILETTEPETTLAQLPPPPPPPERHDPLPGQLGYELVAEPESGFGRAEWAQLVAQLGRLSRERGLDVQQYQCAECGDPLGGCAAPARTCAFSGQYFCAACMDLDTHLIPARVLHNWDLRRYAVSRRAARFLAEVQHRPLLDVRVLSPRAYRGVAALRRARDLRVRANLLRAYAATCRERARLGAELRRTLWPREHLCESVHAYSPADLAQVASGALAAALERVVGLLREHVHSCWLCSQKGFICEVCRAPDALYPFDTEGVYRCERCCGVFHASCQHAGLPCPKCLRRAPHLSPS